MSCDTTTAAPFFGCCPRTELTGLIDYCLVRFSVRTQGGGIPFAGMTSPDGYYPAGDFFSQRAGVMSSVIARAVAEVNAMEFPESVDVALARVANLRHPSPIFPPLPCVRFSSGSDLAVYDAGVGVAAPFAINQHAGSSWAQTTAFTQLVDAYKMRWRFNSSTPACVFQYVQCSLIPIAQEDRASAIEHTVESYGFDILAERAGICPGALSYTMNKELEPGVCP